MNDLIVIKDDKPILSSGIVDDLINIENRMKELKAIQEEYKRQIKEAMEANEVIKISDETTGLTISYIAEQKHLEKFNKEKFQEENPELYDKYVSVNGKKSAYITIRVK